MRFRLKNGHKLYYFNINTFSLLSPFPLLQTATFIHYSDSCFPFTWRSSQRGGRGWQEGQLRTPWASSVAKCSQSPGCRRITCWGTLQSPQRWQHPSCHFCWFPVTYKGTAPPRRPFPIRFFHPPSCSLMAGASQCRCCYPSFPNPWNQLFSLHLPLRAVCQDVLKLGNKQPWFTGLNLPCFLLQCGEIVLIFFLNPILIFSFPFQVCQVKFISVPVPTVTRVKLAFLFALLGFHFSTSLSKINCAPHVFKFHYHDLT